GKPVIRYPVALRSHRTRVQSLPKCFSPSAWLLDASLPIPRVRAGQVPRIHRYYQGTATSCRPSRRISFPSLGGTTGSRIFRSRRRCVRQRWAWGWSPGIPVRAFFCGDDRISQVPGEPQFPFAHVLRPRPADASLTNCGTLAWPPHRERRRHRREDFRGSIAWLSGSPPTYHATVIRLTAQGWPPGAGQALPDGLSPAEFLQKVFNSLHVGYPPSSKLLGTIPFSKT